MKNLSDRGRFEEHWEKAFRNARKKPPDAVWDRINSELTRSELTGYKKRLLFFKWLAAASVLLALGMGFYSLYFTGDRTEGTLKDGSPFVQGPKSGEQQMRVPETGMLQKHDGQKDKDMQFRAERQSAIDNQVGRASRGAAEVAGANTAASERPVNNQASNAKAFVPALADRVRAESHGKESERIDRLSSGANTPGVGYPDQVQTIGVSFVIETPVLPIAYMYRRPVVPVNLKSGKREVPPQLYAGLSFSTGIFDPKFEGGRVESLSSADLALYSSMTARTSNAGNMAENTAISNESYQPDVSYAFGVNMGVRVAGRWVVRGGLGYVKANTIASTTAYIQDNANNEKFPVLKSINYQRDGVLEIRQTEVTQYANTFEFASIPVKAGYIVLDKKIDLILFGGVSSEFFIKNTINQKDNLTNTYQSSPGDDSPYRSVYFNGSLSTALGYTVADHYRLSLEPGYRMALNSFTKDSFVLTGKPDAFYVNFGISYRFK